MYFLGRASSSPFDPHVDVTLDTAEHTRRRLLCRGVELILCPVQIYVHHERDAISNICQMMSFTAGNLEIQVRVDKVVVFEKGEKGFRESGRTD